jgi:DNA-binding Lrp family transcriptional regulator
MDLKKEMVMISAMRADGRKQLSTISRQTGIPISTLFDMVRKTDKIQKHTCLINFAKLGFTMRANVVMKVEQSRKDELKRFLLKCPNLNSLYRINNGYDFMAELIYRELKDLEFFIERLDRFAVKEKSVYYIIEDLARETFLSDASLVALV